jgi:hypothetical protein
VVLVDEVLVRMRRIGTNLLWFRLHCGEVEVGDLREADCVIRSGSA